MTNCLFYALFFTIFLNFGIGGIRFSGVNRTFENMFKGLLVSSVKTINENGEPCSPYFDENILIEEVDSYLKDNMKKYTSDYEARVYFFNNDEFQSICTSHYCNSVKISLKCSINMFFKYNKTKDYFFLDKYYE